MKTVELTKYQPNDERILRLSDKQAAAIVRREDAVYVPKSKYKRIVIQREQQDVHTKLAKTMMSTASEKSEPKDRKHSKKGKPREGRNTGNRQEGSNTQAK